LEIDNLLLCDSYLSVARTKLLSLYLCSKPGSLHVIIYSTGFVVGYEVSSFHIGQIMNIVTQCTWVKTQQVLYRRSGGLQKRC